MTVARPGERETDAVTALFWYKPPAETGHQTMSESERQTKIVFDAFGELTEGRGDDGVRPGDIAALMRERGAPIGAWEIRGELSKLEHLGVITLNAEAGTWHPIPGAVLDEPASRTG